MAFRPVASEDRSFEVPAASAKSREAFSALLVRVSAFVSAARTIETHFLNTNLSSASVWTRLSMRKSKGTLSSASVKPE